MANEILTVSYSKIKAWRFCRQNYYFKYVEEIVPKKKPKPLKLGGLVHNALELLTQGKNWMTIVEEARKEYGKMFQEEKEFYGNYPDETERIITGYLRRYDQEPYKFHSQEKSFGPVNLTDEIVFKFKIDKIAIPIKGLMKGNDFLWETKSGKRIPKDDMRIWDLQTVLYAWGLKQCHHPVKGIIWDYVRTKAPTIPIVLKDGTISRNKNIDTDYYTYHKAIVDNGDDPALYHEILDGLKDKDSDFYRRMIVPVNDSILNSVAEDAMVTALEIYHLFNHPVKSISGFTCPRCDYDSICYAQLRNLDTAFVRKAEYMDKPKKEEDNMNVDETDSE